MDTRCIDEFCRLDEKGKICCERQWNASDCQPALTTVY